MKHTEKRPAPLAKGTGLGKVSCLAARDIQIGSPIALPAQRLSLDFDGINAAALRCLPLILARWLPDGRRRGREWVARNPRRADQRAGSFSINVATGRWCDFATGDKGGDVVSLAAYLFGLTQGDAARDLAAMLGCEVRR